MIFTSYTYALFLALCVAVHWMLPMRARNWFIVFASYFFYASWRPAYVLLLAAITLFNFMCGQWLAQAVSARRLAIGLAANLLVLAYFKYLGFALSATNDLLTVIGAGPLRPWPLPNLPLGVSFFTFQAMAYLVDVAAGDEPVTSLRDFVMFKALWPQLIAGPIIRLHEIRDHITQRVLHYDDVQAGGRRVLQGLFKKVVIADSLAPIADTVFQASIVPGPTDCIVGVLAFALQIYFDFSAYSDIAIGSARLLGFHFPENFNWPYLSASPQEFWTRWHMTLSRWIRDYVFMPLTFAFRARPGTGLLWLVVAMTLCGLWHGAAWTFVVWGLYHGILLALNRTILSGVFADAHATGLRRWFSIALTFVAVCYGWLLFRAQSLRHAGRMTARIFLWQGEIRPTLLRENQLLVVALLLCGVFLAQVERKRIDRTAAALAGPGALSRVARAAIYVAAIVAVVVFDSESQTFVYFQF